MIGTPAISSVSEIKYSQFAQLIFICKSMAVLIEVYDWKKRETKNV